MQSQTAWKEILSDEDVLTELDLSDDHQNEQARLLVYQTIDSQLHVYDGTDTGITVDFDKSVIRLSKVLLYLLLLRPQ